VLCSPQLGPLARITLAQDVHAPDDLRHALLLDWKTKGTFGQWYVGPYQHLYLDKEHIVQGGVCVMINNVTSVPSTPNRRIKRNLSHAQNTASVGFTVKCLLKNP
jgi:hypothetical protein